MRKARDLPRGVSRIDNGFTAHVYRNAGAVYLGFHATAELAAAVVNEYDAAHPRKSTRERFDEKWELDEECGCWIWTGALTSGYGSLRIGGRKGQAVLAHRLSWEFHRGPIPEELYVLHNCPDNRHDRRCCNPDHLFLGTHEDNMVDAARKGRMGKERRRGLPFGVGIANGRYYALIHHCGKRYYLGCFGTPEEAGAIARTTKDRILAGYPLPEPL